VRSTTFEPRGESFLVLRPSGADPRAALVGVRWPRGDEAAQLAATSALGELIERADVLAPSSPAERHRAAAGLMGINYCASCHVPLRAGGEASSLVRRGTDGSGLFQPATVLGDRAPLETYRPRNANLGDARIRLVCGPEGRPSVTAGEPACPGAERLEGIFDVQGAAIAGEPHARRLCASRRYLFDRLDGRGRALFAAAMAECEGGAVR
jgi:hypothetical protein